jgi:ligand-binding sensor domain-containing protein/signal transduction histidine kinase
MKFSRRNWMTIRRFAQGLLLAVLLAAHLRGAAQAQFETIRFEHLSVEDGLSQSTVRAIIQDSLGFMWFGTDDGLNKYDGYTFTVYKHDSEVPTSLADNNTTVIFQDSGGELWIGTANGLDRFNRETEEFEHFLSETGQPGAQGAVVSAIDEDAQGNLWVGTSDNGLYQYDRQAGKFIAYRHNPNNPDTLSSNSVYAVLVDNKNGLWIGTDQGLDYLAKADSPMIHYTHDPRDSTTLSDDIVISLYQDRSGTVWVGTEAGGLNRFNPATKTFNTLEHRPANPYSLSNNLVQVIFEDQSGRLWVGGRGGLNLLNRADDFFSRYRHDPANPYSLSNDYVLSIYSDRSGVLWLGTFGGGLNKYVQSSTRFALYQYRPGTPNSLSNDVVYAIYEDRADNVWIGTMDGGLNRMDLESGIFSVYKNNPIDTGSLSNNDVRAILEDRQRNLWIGTYGGGLNRMEPETGRFTRYVHDTDYPFSIIDNRVTALLEDRRGNLWVGTREGLDLFNPSTGHFTHFKYNASDPSSLSNNYVRVLYEDHAGQLWVGTQSGLNVFDYTTQTFRHYLHNANNSMSLSNNRVVTILETPDHILWIGTLLGGLNRFDPATETFTVYTEKQGLPSDTVYGILVDRAGYLWISTNRGLSRFDPRDETFRNYDRRDGLQSYEFNPGAYFQSRDGRMYFGGIQGFNYFDPLRVQDNPLPPPVIITAFYKFNVTERKDLPAYEKIVLDYTDNFISFEFAALDYNAPEKNQYEYMLEGFDKDWIKAGNRRYASYTNLRGGHYVFHVKGSNQDGVWNEVGASVEITVIPPVWENWWFQGSVAVLLLGLAVLGYRLRVMSMQAQTRQLEAQVKERTQEIERRREVAEGLREILAILNTNRSLKESLDAIVLQVGRLMGTRAVVIFRCDEEGCPIVLASNLQRGSGELLFPLPGWVTLPLLAGQKVILPDLRASKSKTDLSGSPFEPFAALLAAPLVIYDKPDGGLVLLYEQVQNYSDDDLQMAVNFADHAALAIANAQLRSQAEEIAVSAERSRLARDLHDAVTQTLFATSLIAEVLPRLWERNPEAGKQKVTEIRELTRGALAEMRTLLMELRPTALMDVPLPDLLQQLSEAFTGRARVPVELDLDKAIEMPANAKIGFYRIAQEALNNIQKHARATQVKIHLQQVDGRYELAICDNGIGFERNKSLPDHFGLGIMEERAQSIGANIAFDSHLGQGTTIRVSWADGT